MEKKKMSPSPAPNPVKISGIGLHSGQPVSVIIKHAPAGGGIVFIHNGERIPATLDRLSRTERGTTLGGVAVVEHFLSAAYGIGTYDLEVEVTGNELPALDGSALPWVEAIAQVEIRAWNVAQLELKAPIKLADGTANIAAYPYDGFKVDFVVNFDGFGEQKYSFDAKNLNYKEEIAPARTFGYLEELEALKARGLGLGASYENALVLTRSGYANKPRFPDELVRHKILDLIGDLALLGRPLRAHIVANRSGHSLNAELVRRILQASAADKQGGSWRND
jgi:UDP-3-O-acyl N-acetylglucosamine deacetylase